MKENQRNNNHDREFAWRVFAGEFNNSTLDIPPKEDRSPGYLITPLGAKINRLFIVGVLTEIDKIERNGNVSYRARVSDRTGAFYIYVGQFDPKVAQVLAKIEPPEYIAVIGKSRKYSPSERISYVSIRPEKIIIVDKMIRDYWLLDTCKNLKTRIEAVLEAQKLDEPTLEVLQKLGFEPALIQGVIDALKHYKKIDIHAYKNMLVDVLRFLVVDNGIGYSNNEKTIDDANPELEVEFKTGDEIDVESENDEYEFEPISTENNEQTDFSEDEKHVLEIINSFDSEEFEYGVPWHKLMEKSHAEGVDKNIIEDIVNNLLEKGKIYEPMLGRIKTTNL